MVAISVLGATEIRLGMTRIPVPTGKTTELLVRLALEAGVTVRTERLIEDLWGAGADGTARNTLQSKVSALRRALGASVTVTGGRAGYALEVDPGAVDALALPRLVESAQTLVEAGEPEGALQVCTHALAMFRGDVLGDAGDGEWAIPHRLRLEEARLALTEARLAARMALGATSEVIGELEALVGLHPLREGLWALLITALYRDGRQADALAAHRRVRAILRGQLGLEPGPGLRALEEQILQQSPALERAEALGGRPPTLRTDAGNLPGLTSPLVGRADDLAAVAALLEVQRLVTLVGPAGVGKTRTAIEAARRLSARGGVWLVRLDGADSTTSLARTVAETLRLAHEGMLVERVAAVETVLVLDNCEHLVDAVAELTGELLDAAPSLRVLATSQRPLGLDGEAVHPLEPLPLEDAVALFTGRAGRIRPKFALDEGAATVVEEVCRALDGLPLAIELAAARVRSLSVREILRRLDDRFTLLRDPTSRHPERRRALAGAIAWSYDLLFPDDQRGLWALSSFSGGAPLAAAEHVLGVLGVPPAAAVDVVGRLVDRSLVSVDVAADGTVRYRLLDSIRAFALDRLHEAGLAQDAGMAHAAWFAEAADRCAASVRGPGQAACLDLVRAERANIDVALGWTAEHDPALGVRIAVGFGWTWVVLGDGVAGAARLRSALAAAGAAAPPRELATGLLIAGWLEASAGDVEAAQADLDLALQLAERLADDALRADVHRHLAFLRIQQGRPGEVLELAAAGLAEYRRLGRDWGVAATLLLGAFGSIMLGDTASAARAAEDAHQVLTAIGDPWGLVHADAMRGAIAQAEGRFDNAAACLTLAAATSEQLGFLGQAALHLTTLGRAQHRIGAVEQAGATLARAIAAGQAGGDQRIAAMAQVHLARIRRATGDEPAASALLHEADRWYRASGGGDGALLAHCMLASLCAGDPGDLEFVLDEATRTGEHDVEVLALDALAARRAESGDSVAAQAFLERADQLMPGAAHRLDEADRLDAHRARSLLGALR